MVNWRLGFLVYVIWGDVESGTRGASGIGRGEDSLKIKCWCMCGDVTLEEREWLLQGEVGLDEAVNLKPLKA